MTLERRAWTIARVITALLVLVSLRIVYWQMLRGGDLQPVAINLVQAAGKYEDIQGDPDDESREAVEFLTGVSTVTELKSLPQPVIQRTIDMLAMIRRGSIYDRSGRLLASDVETAEGGYTRFYSEPSLAHTIGYVSGLRTGVTGLELSYNDVLLGVDRPDAQVDLMLHRQVTGSDLILTIDSYVQRAAEAALRGRAGAIVVLDAENGAVLAAASGPRFDPNRILDEVYVSDLLNACSGAPECQAPLLNRASQALYSPGSTWKTITLAAALDTGQVSPSAVFDFGEPVKGADGPYYIYEVDGGIIPDPNHTEDRLNLEMAYAKSANAAFAKIGDEMQPDTMIEYAARFGFSAEENRLLPWEIETNPAQLAGDVEELYDNNLLRAATAIGQGELLASPLQMAVMVLSVLHDGDVPVPYLVQAVQRPGGTLLDDLPNRQVVEGLVKPETARTVRDMMIAVVEKGSGGSAAVPGMVTGGKTGTAQVGGNKDPHSWFVGFAEHENRGVVIAVVIENGGEGSKTAAPIFAEIARAALLGAGEPVEEVVPTPVPPPTGTPEAAPTLVQTETPEPEVEETELPVQAGTPTPAPSPTSAPGSVPPPEILRDPGKADLTAANPSCVTNREAPVGTGSFIWPSNYQALSGGNFREGHPGLDLSNPSGTSVYAADTGLVIFAGWSGLGYGNVILIDHGNGFQTLYAHLSQVSTNCGAVVEQGKLIGLSGNTGNSTGPHLHFEVRVPGGYIDPVNVLPVP